MRRLAALELVLHAAAMLVEVHVGNQGGTDVVEADGETYNVLYTRTVGTYMCRDSEI
jgi:hypothetical protein